MTPAAELNYFNFLKTLEKSQSIALTAPAGADGDSVGTQCALKEILETLYPNKAIRIVNEEPCPVRYRFLAQAQHFEVSNDILKQDNRTWPDTFICVDGNEGRLGDQTTRLWAAAKVKGQIDHHAVGVSGPYDLRLYDPRAASTTEIVFNLLKSTKLVLNKTIAQGIYVGLIFDTGLFKHSNTRPEILRLAAELLETAFDHTLTAEKAMLERSPEALDVLRILLNGHQKENAGRYVWSVLNYADFQKTRACEDDKEGLIDQLFLVRGCEVAAFYFERKPGDWKISFRSRNGWDVAALAQSLTPKGGGHRAAAGCSLVGERLEVLQRCHQAVNQLLNG